MSYFEDYFKALQNTPIEEITEHSHRTQLENLLNTIVETHKLKVKILHEPKREGKFGSPDFKITSTESIVGYVENKKVREVLDNTLKTDQLKKYKELSNNILLTNYTEFIWLKGEEIKREQLCYLHDVENRKSVLNPDRIKAVETLIQNFFSQAPQQIDNPKKLAHALAIRAKWLKAFLKDELERQHLEHKEGTLSGLYETFKTYVFHELTLDEFADAFSQNLVYGLFLASLNAGVKKVDLYNAKQFIPGSFELIKELVNFLDELEKPEYKETKWIIEEVLTILNNMAKEALERKLFYRSTKKEDLWGDKEYDFKDPFIYFYEDFLAAYDKKLRKAKGVYYTPPPIVNFIVRAIDDIIVNTLGYREGLADMEKVTVLDFATGTGTFLLEVCKQIFSKVPRNSAKRKLLVKEHILKNLYGFEYLIAPYTIAHLKLSQFLKDEGYTMEGNERLNVFLTNTLEPADKQIKIPLLPALSEETREAQKVKDKPVLVITGNPPYSINSRNNGSWIKEKIESYKWIDGQKLNERNPKALQDDYVKFIRFAQEKMDRVENGIVGIITNHAFLFNPTFRGMRQSLMKTFNQMYFVNLHGNAKMKEKTPDGDKDENVFDIEQGVAISIFVKTKGAPQEIFYSDFYGSRKAKYLKSWEENIKSLKWEKINPISPSYIFQPVDNKQKENYEQFWSLLKIYQINSSGIKTHRDHFSYDFNKPELQVKISDYRNNEISNLSITDKYQLTDTSSFDLQKSRNNLSLINNEEEFYKTCQYRPYDDRILFFHESIVDRPRKELMQHFLKNNLALASGRAGQVIGGDEWNLIFITDKIADVNLFYRGGAVLFPLYLYSNVKNENFTIKFREFANSLYKQEYSSEKILGYIYAVLHSSTYRSKYSEFLKSDFPRVPFTADKKIFEELSELGSELIQANLLKHADVRNHANVDFKGVGNEVVEKAVWNGGKLFINKTQWFEPVTKEVYEFYIGGYQVLDKYLKDRKGRNIQKEIYHICYIIQSLQFTINQMEIIDSKTASWI